MEATMNIARIFAVAITLGMLSTASSQETQKQDAPQAAKPAADAPANAPQAPSGAGNTAQAPPATPSSVSQPATGAQAPASTATPPPPPSAAVGKTGVIKDNEFIPTEEIQPDEAVTFPVDI
jgi:hypothetical protein